MNCPACKKRMQYKMTDHGQVYKCHECKHIYTMEELVECNKPVAPANNNVTKPN